MSETRKEQLLIGGITFFIVAILATFATIAILYIRAHGGVSSVKESVVQDKRVIPAHSECPPIDVFGNCISRRVPTEYLLEVESKGLWGSRSLETISVSKAYYAEAQVGDSYSGPLDAR